MIDQYQKKSLLFFSMVVSQDVVWFWWFHENFCPLFVYIGTHLSVSVKAILTLWGKIFWNIITNYRYYSKLLQLWVTKNILFQKFSWKFVKVYKNYNIWCESLRSVYFRYNLELSQEPNIAKQRQQIFTNTRSWKKKRFKKSWTMSASEQMRAMLDQLMGTSRNGEFLFVF